MFLSFDYDLQKDQRRNGSAKLVIDVDSDIKTLIKTRTCKYFYEKKNPWPQSVIKGCGSDWASIDKSSKQNFGHDITKTRFS